MVIGSSYRPAELEASGDDIEPRASPVGGG
jgi:hypothetical protein